MNRAEIDIAIRRAQNTKTVDVPRARYDEIIGLARLDNASAKLIARAYDAIHIKRDGEAFLRVDAGLYMDLLTAAKRALMPRLV
jgi:hypothetical protein